MIPWVLTIGSADADIPDAKEGSSGIVTANRLASPMPYLERAPVSLLRQELPDLSLCELNWNPHAQWQTPQSVK